MQATRRDFSITLAKKPVQSCPDKLHLVCLCIIYNLFFLKTGVSLHVFKVLLRRLSPEWPPPSTSPLRLWNFKIKAHRHVYRNLVPHIIFLHADWLWSPSCTMSFKQQQLLKCNDCRMHAEHISCLQDCENHHQHHHHTNNGVDKNLPFSLEITWSFDQEARWPG